MSLSLPEAATTSDAPWNDAPLNLEWSLLQAACCANAHQENSGQKREKDRLRELLRTPLNWESALQLAEQHGVMPLLYQAMSALGTEAPSAGWSRLKQQFETNLHRTLFLTRELIRILDHLDARAIDVLPYKGVALAETLYGHIALRQPGDIDLLVRPGDLWRVKDALKEIGYTPHVLFSSAEERAYLRSGYEWAFDSDLGRNLVEVQWALQPRFYAVEFEMEPLFRRAVSVNVAGRNMKTPSPEDLFLILSLHAAKHVWGRLIWLCDISQMLGLPTLNWDWIGETSNSLGVVRIVQVTLLLAKRLLGTAIPAAAKETFSPDQAAIALANQIVQGIGPQSGGSAWCDVESFSYFRLMLRLRERLRDRIRFLQRLAFTPGPGEWQSVALPGSLFPLYRVVRLARLAARFARAALAKD